MFLKDIRSANNAKNSVDWPKSAKPTPGELAEDFDGEAEDSFDIVTGVQS